LASAGLPIALALAAGLASLLLPAGALGGGTRDPLRGDDAGDGHAGSAFSFTVTALDAAAAVDAGYTAPFTSRAATARLVLPANSTLTNGNRDLQRHAEDGWDPAHHRDRHGDRIDHRDQRGDRDERRGRLSFLGRRAVLGDGGERVQLHGHALDPFQQHGRPATWARSTRQAPTPWRSCPATRP